jgi:tetratricopeptide (TPR) repeat protein
MACERHPRKIKLLLRLGGLLAASQRYQEAEILYQNYLAQGMVDARILSALAQIKMQSKDFYAALEILDQLLLLAPQRPSYRLLQADSLYLAEDYDGALQAYALLPTTHKYAAKAWVGRGKCALKLNRQQEAKCAFSAALQVDPNNVSAQYYLAALEGRDVVSLPLEGLQSADYEEWATLYVEKGRSKAAKQLFERILASDPAYFPARMGLAEVLSGQEHFAAALAIYFDLLSTFPLNGKIMLAIARVYSWAKNYQLSLEWYDVLIALQPGDPVPRLEKARVAMWGKLAAKGLAAYDQLLTTTFSSLAQLQTEVALERNEKLLTWDKRYRRALPLFQTLTRAYPGNQEALYDYGQAYCSIGRCDLASSIYRHLLAISPNHKIVKMAQRRNEIRTHPKLGLGLTYWRELGSGTFSQSQIARYQADFIIEQPLSCTSCVRFIQRQWVENPFYNNKFYAAEGQTLEAETLINSYFAGNAGATYKNYFGEFKSRITAHLQLSVHVNDIWQLGFGIARENEVCNYFSMKQAIQYTACSLKVAADISRYCNVEGCYWHLDYNDRNTLQHANLMAQYAFSDTPNVFKVILTGDYYNTKYLTIPIFVGTSTQPIDVIHPYWTPQHYYSGMITLQWRHDYRPIEFCEAPERYLDVKVIAGDDSVDNPSIELSVGWKHEFARHWGVELKGLIHRSKQWNAEGAWASLSYRF